MKKLILFTLLLANLSMFAQNIPSYVPTNGLVGWWPFNGNANDESGNGNNGIATNIQFSSDRNGMLNSSGYFDGLSSNIFISADNNFQPNSYTISAWINTNIIQSGVLGQCLGQTIVSYSPLNWYKGPAYKIALPLTDNSKLVSRQWTSTTSWEDVLSLSNSISQNNWYHCIATFDANTHQQKLYINGLIVGVLSSSILQYSNQIGFIIGASLENSSGTLCDVFNGKLDDIGFWNRALNQAEITALYNSTNINTYQITSSSGVNGSITPSGSVTVNAGSSKRFLFTPNSGYKVDSVIVNGVKVDSLLGYTFDNVSANNTIKVTFKAKPINLTATKTTVCSNNTSTTLTLNSNLTDCTLGNMPTNGLVGYWPFNGNANDESGNGNNGTVNGSVQFINDRNSNSNQAIQGGNGYINMTNNFFRFGRFDYFTVSVWFTVPSYSCSGRLISTESSEGHFRIANYGNGNIAVQFGEYMTVNVSPNVWHHLVYTYSNRNEIVYIDGNSVATGYEQELSELLNYSYPFTIGAKASPAYDLWCGNIDDISIYNRAITQQEVTELYTGQTTNNTNNTSQANILWSTGDTTQTISVTPTQTTKYYCTVTCNGTSYTDSITINVDATAVAGSIAGSGLCTPNTGTTLTLNNSTGTIKWQKSTNYSATTPTWTTITGATATTYATGALTASTAYRAILTSASCGDTTENYVVVVSPKPVAGTAALNGTTSALVCSGSSKSLKLTGSTGSIQWQTASTSAGPWTDIEGATTATYTFENLTTTSLYRAKVSSGVCTEVYSNAITLTVKQPTSAGSISSTSSALCSGSSATITLSDYSGTILWQKSTNYTAATPTWSTATGTTATLSTGVLTASTAYRAVLSNSPCPSSTSSVFAIAVSSKAVAGVAALNYTTDFNVCKGSSKALKLTGASGAIQWQASTTSATTGFTDVDGVTTSTNTFSNIQANTWFRAKVSSGVCPTLYSNVLAITKKDSTNAGTIAASATAVCSGSGATLTLSGASGTILWQKSVNYTAATPTWSTATGTSATLSTGALTASTAYRAVLSNSPCPSSTATMVTVTVSPKAVAGTATVNNTSGLTVCKGSDKPLKLTGSAGSLQWQASTTSATSGFSDVSGATTQPYTFTNIQNNTWYRAKLSSGVCPTLYSNVLAITAKTPTVAGTITTTSGTICAGTGKTLTLSGSSGTIAWQKSTNWSATTPTWVAATGTTASLLTGALSASTAYRAVLTNAPCLSSKAEYIVVTVDPKVVVKTITANVTSPTGTTATTAICASTEKILTLGAGYVGSIQWQRATTAAGPWTSIDGATSATYTVSNPSIGANYFRVKLTSGACAAGYTIPIAVYYKACSSAIPTYVPTSGLVGWWPFNGNANDESGNGNHGTVNGATLTTDRNGNANKAYSFDGSAFIKVNQSTSISNLNQNVTLSCWVKRQGNEMPILCKSEFGGTSIDYRLHFSSINVSFICKGVNYGNSINTNELLPFDSWVLLTLIKSDSLIKLFIGNDLVLNGFTISNSWSHSINNDLYFGADPHGGIEYSIGNLDDIAIWNRALTQAEITAIYTGTTTSGMVQLQSNSLSETTESLNNTILNNTDAVQQKSNEQIETTVFDAITYPNPYENYFHVQLNTTSDEHVAIKVYDMLGKIVEEHIVQPSDLEALQLGKDLSNGEYSVVIIQAGDVVRKRLVRQAH